MKVYGSGQSTRRLQLVQRGLGLFVAVALALGAGSLQASHDQEFELDGNIVNNPGDPPIDWQSLFDVSGTAVPTPKAVPPAHFPVSTFIRDFIPGQTGPDRTTFTTGSKDTLNVTGGWDCARDNNVNDKTDLVNVYAAAHSAGGDTTIYFGMERFSNEGDGNIGFWFFQDKTVSCLAPATGPSTRSFTGNHVDGDLLVVSEFTKGGVINTIKAYRWVGGASGYLNTTPIASGIDCAATPAGDPICAKVNLSPMTPPWLAETKSSGSGFSKVLAPSEFFEGGINLTDVGLDTRCFQRVLGVTRSSQSLTATIFDYALGTLPLCGARITIAPDGTNEVGQPHTFTVHASRDIAGISSPAPDGTIVNVSLTPSAGASPAIQANTCATGTVGGTCSVIFTSATPGKVAGHASATVNVLGNLIPVATDGVAPNSGDAVKTFVDANIQISPLAAANEIGQPHTLVAHVNVNPGTGYANAPDGTLISLNIVSGPGSLGAPSCTTSGGTGSCSVTLTSAVAGVTVVNAATVVNVGGVSLARSTNGVAGNSGSAAKTWVDANIQLSPLAAANEIGQPHTFVAHVNVNAGTGYTNAPDGTIVSLNIVSGPGALSASSCTTSGGTGSCSVTLTSAVAGVTAVNAATVVNVGGVSLSRSTNGVAGNSGPASKTWVDAKIQISPLAAANEVGQAHAFTAHVNVNGGTGYASAPDGTVIALSIASGPGSLSASSCVTGGGTGSCSVTLTSPTPGTTVVGASTTVAVLGVSLSRTTDGTDGNSGPASKTWVDANIQISPASAVNEINQPHTLTAHVNVDAGSGAANAPDGTVITLEVVSGPGALNAPSCATGGGTGSCSVTLTSPTPGGTVVRASTTVAVLGVSLARTTDGTGGNSGPASKTWVDANIQISPLAAANEIGQPHAFAAHVNVNAGAGYANAPDGTVISLSIVSGPGALSSPSCTTSGGTGSCSVTLTSAVAGVTVVGASTAVNVGGVSLVRSTDGTGGNSGPAAKTWVDANIQISPSVGVNEVNQTHTLTVQVNANTGSGYGNAPDGTVVALGVLSGPGSLSAPSCTTSGGTGSCSVTLVSASPGDTLVSASTTIIVAGLALTRSTDGTAGNSGPASKTWVDANIQLSPLAAANEIGQPHTFTAHVNVNAGTGYTNAPDGTVVSLNIVSGPGALGASSCTTSGGTGSCSVTLSSPVAGVTVVNAATAVNVGGVSLSRSTNGAGGNSGPAAKTWVDANIQISPLAAANEVGQPHTFTAHVNVNAGTGYTNAPDGTVISLSIVSGPGSLSVSSCATSGGTGSCSVTLTSALSGVTVVNAATAVNVGGVSLSRSTNGVGGNSGPASKTWVDANIQISPLAAANEVGQPHTFTAHVNVNGGTGYANAPDGTIVSLNIVSGPGALSASSCTTSGGTGSCSVSLTSAVPGATVVSASTVVSVNGVSLSRSTNGTAGNSGPASKTWVDARLTIGPNDTNGINEPHTFTVTVQKNAGEGSGYVAASGEHVNFTLTNAGGASSILDAASSTCDDAGANTNALGQCGIVFTSPSAGTVTGNASVVLVVAGVTLTRDTDPSTAPSSGTGGSGPALKAYVDGSLRWYKNNQLGQLLAGATFEVCRTYTLLAGVMVDTADACASVLDDGDGVDGPLAVGKDQDGTGGEFLLKGLVLGRYTIRETAAPSGYVIVNPNPVVAPDMSLASANVIITTPVVNKPPDQGCTPGYWKNHVERWDRNNDTVSLSVKAAVDALGPPYLYVASGNLGVDDQLYRNVFGLTSAQMTAAGLNPNLTMLQAINLGGGGFEKLARHGVGGLLSAASTDVNYFLNTTQVLIQVRDATIALTPEPLASVLAANNSLQCPLN